MLLLLPRLLVVLLIRCYVLCLYVVTPIGLIVLVLVSSHMLLVRVVMLMGGQHGVAAAGEGSECTIPSALFSQASGETLQKWIKEKAFESVKAKVCTPRTERVDLPSTTN